jgi:predicted  nucleic acid-binding Zn-ribbon protein
MIKESAAKQMGLVSQTNPDEAARLTQAQLNALREELMVAKVRNGALDGEVEVLSGRLQHAEQRALRAEADVAALTEALRHKAVSPSMQNEIDVERTKNARLEAELAVARDRIEMIRKLHNEGRSSSPSEKFELDLREDRLAKTFDKVKEALEAKLDGPAVVHRGMGYAERQEGETEDQFRARLTRAVKIKSVLMMKEEQGLDRPPGIF